MMSVHDEKIEKLLAEVDKRKAELGSRPRNVLKTNGILKFNDRDHINLNTINDIESVVRGFAFVLSEINKISDAMKVLGIETDFDNIIHQGYNLSDWKEDFEYRLNSIEWNKKKLELDTMTKKLESLISEDAKTKNELASIEKLLGE